MNRTKAETVVIEALGGKDIDISHGLPTGFLSTVFERGDVQADSHQIAIEIDELTRALANEILDGKEADTEVRSRLAAELWTSRTVNELVVKVERAISSLA